MMCISGYTVSNGRRINEKWIMNETVMVKFGVPSWNLPESLKENHKRPQAALPEPGLRFVLHPSKHEAKHYIFHFNFLPLLCTWVLQCPGKYEILKLGRSFKTQQRKMEEAPENSKELSHSAHANEWMNESMNESINESINQSINTF